MKCPKTCGCDTCRPDIALSNIPSTKKHYICACGNRGYSALVNDEHYEGCPNYVPKIGEMIAEVEDELERNRIADLHIKIWSELFKIASDHDKKIMLNQVLQELAGFSEVEIKSMFKEPFKQPAENPGYSGYTDFSHLLPPKKVWYKRFWRWAKIKYENF